MTNKQRQQRPMVAPRKSAKQQAIREAYLLQELQKIGYTIQPTGPYQYFIRRAA